jgi:hypothetical protein
VAGAAAMVVVLEEWG